MVILYLGPQIWNVPDGSRIHYTIIFNTFVFMQIFNELNSRKVNNGTRAFATNGERHAIVNVVVGRVVLFA